MTGAKQARIVSIMLILKHLQRNSDMNKSKELLAGAELGI